jgi:hypothetical protein
MLNWRYIQGPLDFKCVDSAAISDSNSASSVLYSTTESLHTSLILLSVHHKGTDDSNVLVSKYRCTADCLCLTAFYQQTETVESLPASHVVTADRVVSRD